MVSLEKCLCRSAYFFIGLFGFLILSYLLFSQQVTCKTLCNPINYSTPGFPVPHHFPEFAEVHVHWISDAIQPSHPLSPSSSCPQSFPASGSFPVSQLFASGGQNIGASASASALAKSIQGWFPLRLTCLISLIPRNAQESFPAPQLEIIISLVLCCLSCLAVTSIRDHWNNHSFDYMDLCWQSDVLAF